MRRFISAWLIFSLFALPGFAQKAASDWQPVRGLSGGTGIVVKSTTGDKFHGAFLAATDESVIIDSDEKGGNRPGRRVQQRIFARAEVQEVRLYNRGGSILAGAGIGGAIGAGIGAGIDLSAKSNEDKGIATAAFTLLGALLGALIGRHAVIVKGELIYLRA